MFIYLLLYVYMMFIVYLHVMACMWMSEDSIILYLGLAN